MCRMNVESLPIVAAYIMVSEFNSVVVDRNINSTNFDKYSLRNKTVCVLVHGHIDSITEDEINPALM